MLHQNTGYFGENLDFHRFTFTLESATPLHEACLWVGRICREQKTNLCIFYEEHFVVFFLVESVSRSSRKYLRHIKQPFGDLTEPLMNTRARK